ncbi:MAG: alcohol dehydrogenase catalytic domain-containing protein, partial [Candidatus Marinimicrobia bacterium]|nr:alcohol dehydrogenase catalytic domain-containing protein [Candidatus Neomarinimicrobiota bacterium]
MKAVLVHNHGDREVLSFEDIPETECIPGKVKVNIQASAINHLDIWVRNGLHGIKVPLPMILGSDAAGTIVETGSGVNKWKPGDEVVIQPGVFCGKCAHC